MRKGIYTKSRIMKKRLDRKFYNRPTLKVAKELLGKYLVVEKDGNYVSGKIVETEAYIGPDDPASHAYRGMTPRNKVMFGDSGYAYVYLTYGMHHCLNFVTERKRFPAAVLIRALEPVEGVDLMKKRRKTDDLKNLTNGPAKLCQALGIDRALNGADLCSDIIYVEDRGLNRTVQARGTTPAEIISTSRIGIKEGKDKRWRFYIENNEFVSK
jgi:DNA-3-methyladenine glycosylase